MSSMSKANFFNRSKPAGAGSFWRFDWVESVYTQMVKSNMDNICNQTTPGN